MRRWFKPMVFVLINKVQRGFQVIEERTPINFRGVIQPLSSEELSMKPEMQRGWIWIWVHADPSLVLKLDDEIVYNGTMYKVMGQKDYRIYGYVSYELVEGYTHATTD